MGMSIIRQNYIMQYWADSAFMGHKTFKIMMSRMDFQNIHANITLHDPNAYHHDVASSDPLWHSRSMLEHFTKKSGGIAVPVGTLASDECMAWMKSKSKACTFLPNKPDKYGIRFLLWLVQNTFTYPALQITGQETQLGYLEPQITAECSEICVCHTTMSLECQTAALIKIHLLPFKFCKWANRQNYYKTPLHPVHNCTAVCIAESLSLVVGEVFTGVAQGEIYLTLGFFLLIFPPCFHVHIHLFLILCSRSAQLVKSITLMCTM